MFAGTGGTGNAGEDDIVCNIASHAMLLTLRHAQEDSDSQDGNANGKEGFRPRHMCVVF